MTVVNGFEKTPIKWKASRIKYALFLTYDMFGCATILLFD
ncbi:hypothetical protein LY39_00296 [Roseinatronobacter bogoriensis subsp. barguzinensis]|nr:hypothetical protein [Rhodobaca bogoriensis DSM 18756]TDW41194.1 hypothetical protein LY39_00296 [Rhodobaca barguzinensis]TDY74628.1 hypothetical protein EV660_101669 [Rhodobaca bogoriensis DSM 18756]